MLQLDPNLPESIMLSQFSGIRNTLAPERLQPGQLEQALNVDLDDTGQPHRRRGYERKVTGTFHSVQTVGGRTFAVKDGVLGLLYTDYTFEELATVGAARVSYAQVGDVTFYTSADASGKISGSDVDTWGTTDDAGVWISPVLTPTDTLGAVGGRYLNAPPLASHITHYKGRIYLAAGRVLWATELYAYDFVDRAGKFIYFEDDITMLHAMEDGLFVGTTKRLYFLSGTYAAGLKQTIASDAGVIPGSAALADRSRVHPSARQQPIADGGAVIFLTSAGVCAGFDGGEVINLTRGRVELPQAQAAAALYRDDLGATSYVVVADSAGTPSGNARVGDYADAEIRRFQGG